ncbi:pyruvate kinase [Paracoccus luteus]|uniref:pyruvate kinase n=1 Tax=Paracoccus luteus TaxID=2508543 RepID=UPI00106F4C4D|nr:pyruvate kinase [Paracoccus luteus]
MRRHRNVKIVATLGPSSSDHATIRALFDAGADVFRLNMSHGTHAEQQARYDIIRAVEAETGRPIAVLADLQGPKLRVGVFAAGAHELDEGDAFRFDLDPAPGDGTRVQLPHPEIFAALSPGSRLLVNDGKIRLRVDACGPDFADCVVTAGGTISNRKGVNVPDVVLPLAALSDKDRADLEFACELGADWLALSFVQRPQDVVDARDLARGRAAILSKIEKPAAVEAFAEILKVSDGIMVARGDLGVELPVHSVPPIQKRLVTACRQAAKPVIVATQMLESMIESPMPTRAEVSDVATAIYEGADAVMLSAESAAGRYPVEAVLTMDSVARSVESDPTYRTMIDSTRSVHNRQTIADSIAVAAREIAETTDVSAICAYTQSGTTVRLAARERPRVPILALTSLPSTLRQMCLVWGAHCVLVPELSRFKQAVTNAARAAREFDFADETQRIIVIAGVPFNTTGSTNILRVAPCDERLIYSTDPE